MIERGAVWLANWCYRNMITWIQYQLVYVIVWCRAVRTFHGAFFILTTDYCPRVYTASVQLEQFVEELKDRWRQRRYG